MARMRGLPLDDLLRQHAGAVMAMLDLVGQIPQELLPRDAGAYSALLMALNILRGAPAQWPARNYSSNEELGLVKPNTAVQARQAQDFRNLMHLGQAQRLAQVCAWATALVAVAAVAMVVRDRS
jgi:hypothetical protein